VTKPQIVSAATTDAPKFRLPDGTRSVQNPWIWRGLLLMSLIALGLCASFAAGGRTFLASAWGIVFAGWFATSMWLWRRHTQYMNS
jgi:hypothetical protein